ncbi:MAG: hypothetical protein WB460_15085 [Candidatus Acidiferrales bacterium]
MSSLAIAELTKRVRNLSREKLLELPPEELAQLEQVLSRAKCEQIDALCREETASFEAGPLLWLTRYTKTENPQYEEQGLPFLAGFPRKSYFVTLFDAFLARERQLYVCKSRTMMTSWAAAGFCAWSAQWKREETVVQTMNEDKAIHLIDYVSQLLKYQEPGLSRLHPIKKQNAFSIVWQDGGAVDAVPGGADAIRSFHPSLFIQDEAAHIAEGEESLNAVVPSQARIISISTASAGWFGDACF